MRTNRLASHLVRTARKNTLTLALELIDTYAPSSDIYSIYWNPSYEKIYISNGDWADYDTNALFQELERLVGKGKVEMEAESQPDNSGEDWIRIDPDTGKPRNP